MNPLVKKAMYAGMGLAAVAKERVEQLIEELAEKGKQIEVKQEEPIVNIEEEETTEEQPQEEEKVEESKSSSIFENYEQKIRNLVETAISKFNFIRNDEHERIEKRIAVLEEKLSKLAQASQATEEVEEEAERV